MPAYREPALPPMLWALACAVLAEQWVLRRSWGLARGLGALVCIGCAAGVACAIMALRGRASAARFTAFAAAALCTGIVVASMAVDAGRAAAEALAETPVSAWSFSVTGDAREQNGRFRVRARARHADGASADVWLYCGERLYPGMVVAGPGRLQQLGDSAWADASRAQGIVASVSIIRLEHRGRRGGLAGLVDGLRMRLIAAIDPERSVARAFIAACTVGDRSGFEALGLDGALKATRARATARSTALVCATGAFVLLCGAPASAVRAWIMVLVHAASVAAHRRDHGLSALCTAALAMALVDPCVTGQLAYQLSVAAVLGIYLANPYLRYMLGVLFPHGRASQGMPAPWRRRMRAAGRAMLDLLSLGLTASLATLPIASSAFSELSLAAPAATLVASPLIVLLTMAGILACALAPVPCAQAAVLACAEPAGRALAVILEAVSGLWFAAVPMLPVLQAAGLAVLACALVLAWFSPKLTRARIATPLAAALIAALLWYGYHRYAAPARLVVLDVGQGDAILIQEGPHAVLVDAGPAGSLADALARNSVFHVDAVIISHLHSDHYGGVADLADGIGCERIVVAAGSAAHAPDELADAARSLGAYPLQEMAYLDEATFGHFRLAMVAPAGPVDGTENGDSMFLLVTYDDGRRTLTALLTGDGEGVELAGVLASADISGIDILKVGHHGSEGSITPAQADALAPAYALCSAGAGNAFGHPHGSTVDALERAGAVFVCTSDAGDIALSPGPYGPYLAANARAPAAPRARRAVVVQFDGYG